MRKNKLLLLLALLMTAATGAWAQTETLLTTITFTGDESYDETTTGVVTVTPINMGWYSEDFGWCWYQSGSLTVEAKEGYTITRCVFKQNDKTPATITSSPFKITFDDDGKCEQSYDMDGVTSIEVYGYASSAPAGYTVSLKDGVKDADKWTVKVGEGQAQALPIGGLKGDGKETVTLQYTGRLKVKGVTATSDAAPAAKPAATVTTAPTGAAIVGVGKSTELVSDGATDSGTLMYAVTTTNTKPASTVGFSDKVPTAQTITASGKVYVWYYVKGDDTHSDSEIAATAIEVPVADIVWDATNVFNSAHQFDDLSPWHTDPLNYEGITISFSGDDSMFVPYGGMGESMLLCYGEEGESFTFTAPSGKKFCKIEINDNSDVVFDEYGDWTSDEINHKIVWSGTAANAVTLGTVYTVANNLNSIGFYLSE
ncbi:hypothetical protein SAMN04487901_10251 [Prevotella communis]|uniref:Uncharacterized protein n=1 Tax=Prevotella communis TaxID=2913614 RepID=A0A1G7SZ02_9BACT|nr:hypothetical protein [Prevotella communis]SDG28004.1 hypothetical protein SAMN04487901_10251 [Prevotella communis]